MSDAADNDAASTTSSAVGGAGSEAETAGTVAMDSEATMTLWAQAPANDVDHMKVRGGPARGGTWPSSRSSSAAARTQA